MSLGNKYNSTPYFESPNYAVVLKLEALLNVENTEEVQKQLKSCIVELKQIDRDQFPYYYDHSNIPWKKRKPLIYGFTNNTNVKQNPTEPVNLL